ncbi:MAG: hypothetical protein HQM14_02135 [SAR324 cluster bacterium]|nr:hypothetical protein [SAR324 cluster bacterium]
MNNKQFLCCITFLILGVNVTFAIPAMLPEIQLYHTLGNRGSSYSTVAGGLAIQLSTQQIGPNRWLHVLGVYSPEQIGAARGKVAGWNFHSNGRGLEIGIYDQKRMMNYFKGANIALRHIEWNETHTGHKTGKISTDIVHLGWTTGSKILILFGLDLATIHTPENSIMELEIALGSKIAF